MVLWKFGFRFIETKWGVDDLVSYLTPELVAYAINSVDTEGWLKEDFEVHGKYWQDHTSGDFMAYLGDGLEKIKSNYFVYDVGGDGEQYDIYEWDESRFLDFVCEKYPHFMNDEAKSAYTARRI
jgi:hypothetical protein